SSLTTPTLSHVVRPGASCGVTFGRCGDGATGTIGVIVAQGAKRFFLSSAHVLARSNGFLLGAPILCPGPLELPPLDGEGHGHGSENGHEPSHLPEARDFQRGRLAGFVPLSLQEPNLMDAAIAEIDAEDFDAEVLEIGRLSSTTPVAPYKGMTVEKHGFA